MPKRIKTAKQRAELAKLTVWLVEYICQQYMGDEMFSASSGDVMLCCGIFVGQAEGRPMTAGNLADYIGMPRPTVVRRLKALEKRGLVEMDGSKALLPMCIINSPAMTTGEVVRRVHRVSANLSKMDSKPIA